MPDPRIAILFRTHQWDDFRPLVQAMRDQGIDCVPTFGPNLVTRWSFRWSLERCPIPT